MVAVGEDGGFPVGGGCVCCCLFVGLLYVSAETVAWLENLEGGGGEQRFTGGFSSMSSPPGPGFAAMFAKTPSWPPAAI